MKKLLPAFFAASIIFCGCSKNNSVVPVEKKSFKISLLVTVNAVVNSTWQQVVGGKAALKFNAINSDTVTVASITDSLDLKNIAAYKKQVISNTYDVTFNTVSTAVADTFIRFNAKASNLVIKKDTTISFSAATTDGVITIKKSLIASGTKPTFTPQGSATKYNFGSSNDYYFIYVTGATSGMISFIETTSGDVYLKDINVAALNQYDLTARLNSFNAVSVNVHSFKSIINSLKN